jgi:hypothetical protein
MRRGRRGRRRVRGCTIRGGGDGSTLGSASSDRFRSSHFVRSPVAPRDYNRFVIIPLWRQVSLSYFCVVF